MKKKKQITINNPEISATSEEVVNNNPEISATSEEVTNNNPEISATSEEVTNNNPEISATSEEVTNNNPEISATSEEVSNNNPEISATSEELARMQVAIFGSVIPKTQKPSTVNAGKTSTKCSILHISDANKFKNEKFMTVLFCVLGIIPVTLNNKIVSPLMKRILKLSSSGINTCYQDLFSQSKNGEIKYMNNTYYAVKGNTGNSPDCFLPEPIPIIKKDAETLFHAFCASTYPNKDSGMLYKTFYLSFRE